MNSIECTRNSDEENMTTEENETKYNQSLWYNLHDTILLQIFSYLDHIEVLNAGLVCKSWNNISYDNLLWRDLFHRDFKINSTLHTSCKPKTWLSEYKRLCYHIPIAETETLSQHDDEVLHVSFAHNGKLFATCSKDGYIMVWNSEYPVNLKYQQDMQTYVWKFTQYSQFNKSDTLLVVSGVLYGTSPKISGEIAVFSLQDGFELKFRIKTKPFDINGAWYSDQYLLSGYLHCFSHLNSISVLSSLKISKESKPEQPITSQLYRFKNENGSFIRTIIVANCLPDSNLNEPAVDEDEEEEFKIDAETYIIFNTGCKVNTPHQIGFKRVRSRSFSKKIYSGTSLKEFSPHADGLTDTFDKPDHVIEMNAHIIGMALSPDHRHLYVNSRSWPEGFVIENPMDPPPASQEIDIQVIDLVTLEKVGTLLKGHKAFTPNYDCFYIYLDVCHEYVASGAEDGYGYLWDRHYEICLAKFPHTDVVNAVAFNPRDPEMLVTTSDDYSIKVWRSRAKIQQFGLDVNQFPKAVEIRKLTEHH